MLSSADLSALLPQALNTTTLPLPGRQTGKVREWYPLGAGRRLLITTDRLSAFDRVLACVPYKGQVLNQLAAWWFGQTQSVIPNHLLALPDANAAVVIEVEPFPVEVIVRGYITGVTSTALWYRYAQGERTIYGYSFPDGLKKNESLPAPIITPTTKGGPTGHDERLTCAEVVTRGLIAAGDWEQIQAAAQALFQVGQAAAHQAGLILVDTKYEFGRTPDGQIMLIDEIHTPDSSRFWKADTYPLRLFRQEEPENFDKEFVRLTYAEKNYRGEGEPPELPADVWVAASQRYMTIYEMLTGQPFVPEAYPVEPRLRDHLQAAGYLA